MLSLPFVVKGATVVRATRDEIDSLALELGYPHVHLLTDADRKAVHAVWEDRQQSPRPAEVASPHCQGHYKSQFPNSPRTNFTM